MEHEEHADGPHQLGDKYIQFFLMETAFGAALVHVGRPHVRTFCIKRHCTSVARICGKHNTCGKGTYVNSCHVRRCGKYGILYSDYNVSRISRMKNFFYRVNI